jgi:integrase
MDQKYLERRPARTGRWYVVKDVPADVRGGVLGKRLVRALGTHDLSKARSMRYAILADFERKIAAARVGGALSWREALTALDRGDTSLVKVWDDKGAPISDPRELKQLALAVLEDEADVLASERGEAAAREFVGVARGTATPILLHLETFLAQGNRRTTPSASTAQAYRTNVTLLAGMLVPHGCTTLEGVTRALAGRVVNEMAARGDNPGTIHVRVAAMSSYWRWLQRRGLADDTVRNVWHEQGVGQGEQSDKRPFTDDELRALLTGSDPAGTRGPARATGADERQDVMRILALSGMRVHELYNLRVADCADGWFDIRASKTKAGVRKVPIHSALAGIVEARSAGKATGAFLIHEAGPASVRRSGAFVQDFQRYRKACGVHEETEGRQSAATLHSFRSWFASAIRAEHDEGVAATLLGHAKRNITDRSYTKFTAERLRAAVESVALPALAG